MPRTTISKIESIRAEMEELKKEERELLQKHRKEERDARTHRLCKRGGIVEKLLPDLIAFTDEQFDKFIEKTLLTSHTNKIIAELKAQGGEPAVTKSTQTAQNDGVDAPEETG